MLLQSLAVRSEDAVTTSSPSGEKTAVHNGPRCPFRFPRHSPEALLQSLAVLSTFRCHIAGPRDKFS